jgi:hypothetical protein
VENGRENTGNQTEGKKHIKQCTQTGSASSEIQNENNPGDTRTDD